jgi:hypothetical protein
MSSQASLPGLLDLYPGEQVFPLDRLQQGGMVGGHVRSDCRDDGPRRCRPIEGRSSVRLRQPTDISVDVEKAAEAVHRAESKVALGEWKRAWAPSLAALFVAERTLLPGEDAPWIVEQRRLLG